MITINLLTNRILNPNSIYPFEVIIPDYKKYYVNQSYLLEQGEYNRIQNIIKSKSLAILNLKYNPYIIFHELYNFVAINSLKNNIEIKEIYS